MKRLLPFRDYDEHDVVNLFALNTANTYISDTGNGDNGVIVKVTAGDITNDAAQYVTTAYLGKTEFPYVGRNRYPEVPIKVGVATSGANDALGITLKETALYDENGEKLLYYRQKALENDIVLSGQAVPVLTRGTVMLDAHAFQSNTVPAVGTRLTAGDDGKFLTLPSQMTGAAGAFTGITNPVYGKVLATGIRVAGNTWDYQAGAPAGTGRYALVHFDFN